MNEFESVSVRQMDRLVDNELSDTDRRDVLLAIDQDPDGWRRLALAFVEAQVLRDELRRVFRTAASPPPMVVTPLPVKSRTGLQWRSVVALAACGILMFGLGRWSSAPSDQMARIAPRIQPPIQTYEPRIPSHDASPMVAQAESPEIEQQQTLRLALENVPGGPVQTVDVPVLDEAQVAPEDLLNAPSVISESVQRALLLSGMRIREQRQLYEVRLEDGRHGVVPISDVRVENTGWDMFQ